MLYIYCVKVYNLWKTPQPVDKPVDFVEKNGL